MNQEMNLEQLFTQARNHAPEVPFEETKKTFLTALILSAGGVLATNSVLKIITVKKWMMILSAVSIITTTAVLSIAYTGKSPEITATKAIENKEVHELNALPEEPILAQDENISNVTDVVEEKREEKKEHFEASMKEEGLTFSAPIPLKNFVVVNNLPKEDAVVLTNNAAVPLERSELPQVETRFIPSSNDSIREFEITEHSTLADIEAIEIEAKKAGVTFKCNADYKGDKIVQLDLKVKLRTNGSTNYRTVQIKEEGNTCGFSYVFGWEVDKQGKACDLYFEDDDYFGEKRSFNELNPYLEEVDEWMEELNFSEACTFADSLSNEIIQELELEWVEFNNQMDSLNQELKEFMEDCEIQSQIQHFSERADLLFEEMSLEIQVLEMKIEAAIQEKKNN